MILLDYREETKTKKAKNLDLLQHFAKLGVRTDKANLDFGDACFEGNGPHGCILIGIERKGLHDMLNCIDDARFSGHQMIGMAPMYPVRVLMLEGHWKPHDGNGLLMEGFNAGTSYGYCKYRSQQVMYNKLYRYLVSVQLAGVIVSYSRDPFHTAFNIVEWYHYFQKKWRDHTSMLEVQKIAIPTLHGKPSLVLKWANDLEGIGVKLGQDAARMFRKPITLANADESDWLRVPGIGVKTAQSIVREIWGNK